MTRVPPLANRPRPAVIGVITRDLNQREAARSPAPASAPMRSHSRAGGVGYYATTAYLNLGLRPLLATLGEAGEHDPVPGFRRAGTQVVCRYVPAAHHFNNVYAADGSRQQLVEHVAPALDDALASQAIRHADWLHVGPLLPDDLTPRLLERLAETSAPVAIDLQGYTRAVVDGRVVAAAAPALEAALRAADVIKADEPEWQTVCQACAVNDSATLLRRYDIALGLITRGTEGGTALQNRLVAPTHQPPNARIARGADQAVVAYRWHAAPALDADPTGAGDTFLAAFLGALFVSPPTRRAALAAAPLAASLNAAARFVSTRLQQRGTGERAAPP